MEVKIIAILVFGGVFSFVAVSTTAQSCPANFASGAQIVITGESMMGPVSDLAGAYVLDTNLTFFREVLGYSDNEVEQETQNALQFFNERFGLDFSDSQPNEKGMRFFQNSTLEPTRSRPFGVTSTFNRWILNGNIRSKCFFTLIGGFFVSFAGEQTLKGTYGGEEGIVVANDRALEYEYISISVPFIEPVVIRRQTPIPNEAQRIGLFVLFYELYHETLGQGAQQGHFQTEIVPETGLIRDSGSAVLTFPANVLRFS